jgi:pimeloyl-ACP methyl ester carboxylesterase
MSPPFLKHAYFEGHDIYPFQAHATTFSLVNAWWLAEASTLAYADEAFATERFRMAGLEDVRLFDKGSTQCYVANNREFAVVAFRGSEILRRGGLDGRVVVAHLMTNADVWLADWPNGGKVHRGFRNALDDVWDDLYVYLTKLQGGGRQIWMTGHSLGAALATLAADRFGAVRGVYTFGSPRVGNRRFKETYRIRAYRFVNGNDIVARVPPPGFYAHVGDAKFIDHEGIIRDRPAETAHPSIPSESEALRRERAPNRNDQISQPVHFLADAVTDHVPVLYAIQIWNSLVAGRPHAQ